MKTIGDVFFSETSPQTFVTSLWSGKATSEPFMEGVLITVELIFGSGKRVKVSTELVEVLDQDSRNIAFIPALEAEPDIKVGYTFGNSSAQVRSYALTIDGRHVDPMSEILAGNMLGGYAEISLQYDGSEYKNRYLLLRGEMTGGVVFGADGEFIEVEISDPKIGNEMIVPERIADQEAFPTIPNDYNGKRIPLVYYAHPFVPSLRLSANPYGPTFCVAYGHNFTIHNVYVDGALKASNDADYPWVAEELYSANGIPYTAVNFGTGGSSLVGLTAITATRWENQSVYVDISSNAKNGNIFDIIRDITLENSNLGVKGVDYLMNGRSEAKAPFLKAKCLINSSDTRSVATAITYIENTLLKSFPMLSMVFTGFGLGAVLSDRTYNVVTANLVLEQNLILGRLTALKETEKSQLYNDFALLYSYNPISDNFEKIITLNSDTNSICAISESKIGKRSMPPIESVVIYDDVTANYVMNWMVSHLTLPSYYVEYEGVPSLFFGVKTGDVVTLTDDKLGFKNERCTVEKITYSRGRSIIGLRIWILYKNVTN